MNQSVMMTIAAKRQNSLTGLTLIEIHTTPRRKRSASEVTAIVEPTLLRPRPILTGTEWEKGTENTARVKLPMFSAPTTTMTKGRMYIGNEVSLPCPHPHPFHPSSDRTEKDMTEEQQS